MLHCYATKNLMCRGTGLVAFLWKSDILRLHRAPHILLNVYVFGSFRGYGTFRERVLGVVFGRGWYSGCCRQLTGTSGRVAVSATLGRLICISNSLSPNFKTAMSPKSCYPCSTQNNARISRRVSYIPRVMPLVTPVIRWSPPRNSVFPFPPLPSDAMSHP